MCVARRNHILLSNRSAAYCANKEYDSAIQDAEQCIALKKEWWKGFARKGAAYVGLQFWDEAIDAYKQALALSPDNENTIKALRQVYWLVDLTLISPQALRFGKHGAVFLRRRRATKRALSLSFYKYTYCMPMMFLPCGSLDGGGGAGSRSQG